MIKWLEKLLALRRIPQNLLTVSVLTALSLIPALALCQINGGGPNGGGGGGSGTVTSVTCGTGLSGGTITTSGTCALTSPITTPVSLTSLVNQGTTTTVLHGNAAGNPAFSTVNLATDVGSTLSLANLATCTAAQILFASSSTVTVCSSKLTWTDSTATLSLGAPGGSVTVTMPNATSGNAGSFVFNGAKGAGAGNGANVTFNGGAAGATGRGGTLAFSAGNGGTTSGAGGFLQFTAGNAGPGGSNTGGDMSLQAGQGAGAGQAGAVIMAGGSGDPTSNGGGGTLNLSGGPGGGTGGVGGTVLIAGGTASGAQAGGDIFMSGGSAGSGAAGRVIVADQNGANAFLVDGVGHISYAGTAPAPSACGTSPSIDAHATDSSGTVTVGSGVVASCTVTFSVAFTTWVHCRVTPQTTITSFAYSDTLAHIVVTGTSLTSDKFDYSCDGS